ncbi:MAG: EF-hand domain-containing protein [Pseudomonas oryzihabitans]
MISGIGSGYSSYYGSAGAIKGNCGSSANSGIGSSDDDNPLKKLFTKLDGDGDGSISKSELTTAASASRDSSDTSGDIDVDKLLGMLDQDGDGSVGENEFASAFAPPTAAGGARNGESPGDLASGAQGRLPPPPPKASDGGSSSSDRADQATSSPYDQLVQAVLRQYQSIGSYGSATDSGSSLSVAA